MNTRKSESCFWGSIQLLFYFIFIFILFNLFDYFFSCSCPPPTSEVTLKSPCLVWFLSPSTRNSRAERTFPHSNFDKSSNSCSPSICLLVRSSDSFALIVLCSTCSRSQSNFTLHLETDTSSISKMDSYGAPPQGRGCYNCGDASHQARDCPTRGPAKCYNCGGEGHMSRECPEGPKDKTCYKCGQPGHISRDCTNPSAEGGAGRGGFSAGGGGGGQECYKCSKVGHIARNCPEAAGGYGGGGYGGNQGGYGGGGGFGGRQGGQTCYSCGGYGHMSRDCTQGQKCYNCGEVGHLSRDCPSETSSERTCYKCKQPGHVQAQCPN